MEIVKIKAALNITTVLQHYGLQADKNHMLKCTFPASVNTTAGGHQDKTPSLKIYPETNTFNCFGCGANGDVIEFIQLKEGITKHEAITKASQLLPGSNIKIPTKTKTDPQGKIEFLEKMFTYFRYAIKSSAPARKYAQERGLDIFKTEIGFNSGQFYHGKRYSKELVNACVEHGLLSPTFQKTSSGSDTGYTSFGKGSLVSPLKNKSGNVTGLYFRSANDKKETKHLYLKNREGLYPNYPSPVAKKLILTEAIIDSVTLLQLSEITTSYEIFTC